MRVNTPSPTELTHAQLDAQLHALQKRAFAIYEDAALRAEADPAQSDAAYARAEADAAPLIAQAKALNEERVRRLRGRVRLWRWLAIAIAVVGGGIVAWVLTHANA